MLTSAELAMLRAMDNGAVLPGIDTQTGNRLPLDSMLQLSQLPTRVDAPIMHYWAAANVVYITQPGAFISGINFGSAHVYIAADNVTVKDCYFLFGSISEGANYSGGVIENCTFTNNSTPTTNLNFIRA